jgi:hypothetical protein
MLDDFKTELKRLGMQRIQKEGMRLQSFALVQDGGGEDGGVEFAEALNSRARLLNGNHLSPGNSPNWRLRQDSMSNGSADNRGAPKPQTGKGGTKISQLPGLKSFQFGKKKEKSGDDAHGLEKQQNP